VCTEPAVKGDDDGELSDTPLARKRNREAVRKYRQRKREQTQSLTQEVEQLRLDNARLMAELRQHNKLKEELNVLRMVVNSAPEEQRPGHPPTFVRDATRAPLSARAFKSFASSMCSNTGRERGG
jgi:hypothetical protein